MLLLLSSTDPQKDILSQFKNYRKYFLKKERTSSKCFYSKRSSFIYGNDKLVKKISIWFFKVDFCLLYRGLQE